MKKEWFTQIPNSLIKTGKLDYRELALYTYYKSFAGENGYCNRTVANTSKDLHMEKKTVIKVRDRLVVKGVITLEKVNQRVYRIYITNYWKTNELDQKAYQVGVKSVIEEEPINNLYKEDSIINENSFELLDGAFVGEVVKEPYIESNMTHSEQCHTALFDVREEIEMNEPILEKKTYPRTDSEFLNKALDEIEKGVPVPVVTSRYFVYKNEILDIIGKYPLTN